MSCTFIKYIVQIVLQPEGTIIKLEFCSPLQTNVIFKWFCNTMNYNSTFHSLMHLNILTFTYIDSEPLMLPYNETYEFNALLRWKDWYIMSMRTIPNKISTPTVTPFLGYKILDNNVVYHVNSKKTSYYHSIGWFS